MGWDGTMARASRMNERWRAFSSSLIEEVNSGWLGGMDSKGGAAMVLMPDDASGCAEELNKRPNLLGLPMEVIS